MDEIKYKLNSDNVIVVTEAMSLLLKSIEKYVKINNNSELDQYLQLLRDLCVSSNSTINSTACFSYIKLIQDGILDTESCLSSITSLLVSVQYVIKLMIVIFV